MYSGVPAVGGASGGYPPILSQDAGQIQIFQAMIRQQRSLVANAALAHVPGNATVQAYARTDCLELRRPIMDEWAAFGAG
jgi:hypothetical protein